MSTWIVLLINVFLNKKIVLIGHGISVKKYQKEKAKQPFLRWLLYKFAGNALFYYDREKGFFDRDLPSLNSSTFDNTISGADEIISLDPIHDDEKDGLKAVHKISTDINFIFCARFHSKNRKSYLIIDFIKKFDLKKYGLIIIGEGPFKPDFKDLKNVYDYGKLFDLKIKTELFQIADFYFQPSYLGLSGIEGLLFGLPVLTLDRSNNNLHGVEFNNLINGYNAIISDDLDMLKESVSKLSIEDVLRLKSNAKNYSKTKLSMNNSVNKTYKFLEAIRS